MPRSKRNKVVSLTKTRSKGRPQKTKLVEDLRAAVDEYEHIYVFSFENMRASIFKDIRLHFRESRIFMGKNKIAQVALGRTPEDEFKDNLRHLSTKLEGDAGLLFTNRSKEEVLTYFTNFTSPEYAKAGAVLEEDVIIPPGPLTFPATMLDQLRKLGLIVEIDDTVIHLREPFTAAIAGAALTPEQAKMLAHMEMRTLLDCMRVADMIEDTVHELQLVGFYPDDGTFKGQWNFFGQKFLPCQLNLNQCTFEHLRHDPNYL